MGKKVRIADVFALGSAMNMARASIHNIQQDVQPYHWRCDPQDVRDVKDTKLALTP